MLYYITSLDKVAWHLFSDFTLNIFKGRKKDFQSSSVQLRGKIDPNLVESIPR